MKTFVFLFLFISFFSFGQKKEGQALIDSLLVELPKMKEDTLKVNLLNELAFNFPKIYPNEGIKYAKKALLLSKKLNWRNGIATSHQSIGENLSADSNYKNALLNFEIALKLATNKKRISQILGSIGLVYSRLNNYPKALEYYNKSLKIFEEIRDIKGQGVVLSNIGIVYLDLTNYKKAILFFEKALAINEKLGVKSNLIKNLGNLGTCYTNLKKNEKALDFYSKAIKLSDEIGQKNSKTINLYSIGLTYFSLKEYEKSLKFSNESLNLSREIGNKMGLIKNYGLIGDIFLEKAKTEKKQTQKKEYLIKAFNNLTESLKLSKIIGETSETASNYSQIAETQKLQGNYKDALKSYELSVIYKDSIFNSENKESIKNLEDKREIELRDKEIKINKLQLQAKEKQKVLYLLGLILFAITGGLLFYQSRNRKKNSERLQVLNKNLEIKNAQLDEANKTKMRFFNILNHDLRNPVSNLIDFLHIQKNSPDLLNSATKNRIQETTLTSAENLLTSMEDILLWSKGQMDNFKPKFINVAVNSLFEDTKKHFLSEEKINIIFENPDNIQIFTDENYLKTIIRNLTGNAIKALVDQPNPTIIWKAWQEPVRLGENNQTFLSIKDNGKGASNEQFRALYDENEVVGIKTGLGLHLIRDLAKTINCTIEVDTKPNFGTVFKLAFK